jgi:hypothetical protein
MKVSAFKTNNACPLKIRPGVIAIAVPGQVFLESPPPASGISALKKPVFRLPIR